MNQKLRICIISEYAYSSLNSIGKEIGGAELQMILLAKGLIKRGYDVHLIAFSKSKNSFELIDGIKVHIPYDNKSSGFTHFYPLNLYKLLKLLNKINADIYIQSAGFPIAGITAFLAKLNNKIFIYASSSDHSVSTYLTIKKVKDLELIPYIYGIKNATCVVCQTENQKKLLKSSLSKEGIIIKTFIPIKQCNEFEQVTNEILWAGRVIKGKLPELYLELAKRLPEYKFKMIGAPFINDLDYYNEIKEKALKIKNVDFLGFVPHNEIDKYYNNSDIFISTSNAEGFPNTFLEAWNCGIPIISIHFDPDNLIKKCNLGLYSNNFEELVKNTKKLMVDENLRKELGENGRKYVKNEHGVSKILDDYENLFYNLK